MGDLGHGRGLLAGTLSGKSADAAQLYDPRHEARICGKAGGQEAIRVSSGARRGYLLFRYPLI